MLNVKIIVGSTRSGRFSEKLLPWLDAALKQHSNLVVEVLDLKDNPLPLFDQAVSPAYVSDGNYGNAAVNAWGQKIKEADAFIIITPEYNHGTSAVLKNAIDAVYGEWNRKAVGFIAYGSAGGARAVEQLRQVAVEVQMASTRNAVHIMAPWNLKNEDGTLKDGVLDAYTQPLENMLNELEWWGSALKAARG